jgi:hypothetical protein
LRDARAQIIMTPSRPRSFCYVLTDPNLGRYAAMTAVSAAATRELHPNEQINVISDTVTARRLNDARHLLSRFATNVIAVETPYPADVKLQSRYLKTTLRKHVAGDLIFLDSDAVPLRDLEPLFQWDGDFCIAWDNNAPTATATLRPEHVSELKRMNWTVPPVYFNSGVFLARDVPTVHALFGQWHARWLQYVAGGRHQDQLSLNSIVTTSGVRLGVLPPAYNAQIRVREDSIRNAAIVHFFQSFGGLDATVFSEMVEEVLSTGQLDMKGIRTFHRTRYPWKARDSMRRFYWTGHPFLAAGVVVRKSLSKILRKSAKQA